MKHLPRASTFPITVYARAHSPVHRLQLLNSRHPNWELRPGNCDLETATWKPGQGELEVRHQALSLLPHPTHNLGQVRFEKLKSALANRLASDFGQSWFASTKACQSVVPSVMQMPGQVRAFRKIQQIQSKSSQFPTAVTLLLQLSVRFRYDWNQFETTPETIKPESPFPVFWFFSE